METAPQKRYERAHTNGKKTKSIHRQVQGQGGDGGGQVVEWVGLVTSSFQFLLGLAAVFAEEGDGFFFL